MTTQTHPLTDEEARAINEALALYNSVYDNATYCQVTVRFTTRTANRLLDDAMALVGCPGFTLSRTRWGKPARDFLARFAEARS